MNFRNWAKSNNPTYKKWANNFISSNSGYNVIKTAKNNAPLRNYVNIPTINSMLTVSRAANLGTAGSGARIIAASGMATAIRKSNNVEKFLSSIKAVINDSKVKKNSFVSISKLARNLDLNMMKVAQQYFAGLPENSPGLSANLIEKIGSITSNGRFTPRGGSVYNSNTSNLRNTVESRRQALKIALESNEAFYKGLSAAGLNAEVPQSAAYKKDIAKIREIFNSVNTWNANTRNAEAILNRANLNNSRATQFEALYRTFLSTHGGSARNAMHNAIVFKTRGAKKNYYTELMRRMKSVV